VTERSFHDFSDSDLVPLNALGGRDGAGFMPDRNEPNWGRFAGHGLNIALGVGLGYFVGHWLDVRHGWGSRGVLVGTLLGFAGGMYLLIKDAIRLNKD
jgi:hypothetical protein